MKKRLDNYPSWLPEKHQCWQKFKCRRVIRREDCSQIKRKKLPILIRPSLHEMIHQNQNWTHVFCTRRKCTQIIGQLESIFRFISFILCSQQLVSALRLSRTDILMVCRLSRRKTKKRWEYEVSLTWVRYNYLLCPYL